MYLQKIILKNFRQFYGEQEIVFATDKTKNVTLIHAENGVGKTTLLNALLWCFYEELTTRFENHEKIVSNQAIEEEDFEASVEVYFEHDSQDYFVKRSTNERYTDEGEFNAYLINNGNWDSIPSPNVLVESVIPREMSKYFFFDGEYAETFAGNKNKHEVRKAVESMLGCNTAIQAKNDLLSVKKSIDKQIGALTKNDQSNGLQIEIDKLEEQTRSEEAEIIMFNSDLEFAETAQREIQDKLRNSEGAKDIQERRDRFQELKFKADKKKIKIEAQRVRWLEQYSVGLLSSKANEACLKMIENENIKGQIPSKIAETFVNDIIESQNCICDRTFEQNSTEERAIKKLLAEAGTATMSDRLLNIRKRMGMIEQAKDTAIQEFQDVSGQLDTINNEIQDYEAQIKECSTQLQSSQVTEIAERERALEERNTEIRELIQKITRHEKACEDRAKTIDKKRNLRNKMLVHNDQAKGLQDKIKLLDLTIIRLDEELDKYREESRKKIIESVNGILEKTARRSYYANIDENFNLDMHHGSTKLPVAKSSGENQLLSLAFIASLVGFAADRRAEVSNLLKPGTMAPLMLDSPFGQLDPTYRQSTAEFLPSLAGQVILLVSKTQGDDDVIDALGGKVGAEYVLISEVTEEQGDKPSDIIHLHGKDIACSIYESNKNQTRISKVGGDVK